ncbi:hypothetical protein THAOC_00038, partial [Thalassiosira oceanica]
GLLAETYGSDWRDEIRGQINGSKGQGGSGAMMPRLPSDDPSRNNFCGVSWGDASKSCEHWCAGEDDDCPGNLKCFAQTMCYYDEDLVPSASPLPRSETDAPTNPPLDYDDPGLLGANIYLKTELQQFVAITSQVFDVKKLR